MLMSDGSPPTNTLSTPPPPPFPSSPFLFLGGGVFNVVQYRPPQDHKSLGKRGARYWRERAREGRGSAIIIEIMPLAVFCEPGSRVPQAW